MPSGTGEPPSSSESVEVEDRVMDDLTVELGSYHTDAPTGNVVTHVVQVETTLHHLILEARHIHDPTTERMLLTARDLIDAALSRHRASLATGRPDDKLAYYLGKIIVDNH